MNQFMGLTSLFSYLHHTSGPKMPYFLGEQQLYLRIKKKKKIKKSQKILGYLIKSRNVGKLSSEMVVTFPGSKSGMMESYRL